MKSGTDIKGGRRRFLQQFALLLAIPSSFWTACKNTARRIALRFSGAPVTLGHRLLLKDFPPPTQEEKTKILIVGAGIAGLSAARALAKSGERDFILLELDHRAGGNASWGENAYTAHPLGAHYLPLPNRHDSALNEFLSEEGIIKAYDPAGAPVFEESFLAAAPHARLYIHDRWQEGLVPAFGVPEESLAQIRAFFQLMEEYKQLRGTDGKYIFDIPMRHASADMAYRHLDNISLEQWLQKEGFTAPELLEHLNYCCLDDFGIGLARVSAWAGIHYFAARKSAQENVLTWPEGNGFLVKCLERHLTDGQLRRQHLAYEIDPQPGALTLTAYDEARQCSVRFKAEKIILATPQFVTQRLLPARALDLSAFHYAPWLVATLILNDLPSNSGMPICWDNVIFQGKGLGYIHTTHQSLKQKHAKVVITYYCAFDGPDLSALRRALYQNDAQYWQTFILDDLKRAHPNIESSLEQIDIQRWGHGMISPVAGFIFGPALAAACKPLELPIYLAHSDLSGMSLFEEAFHQGLEAAKRCISATF